jgi:hypothetical protein
MSFESGSISFRMFYNDQPLCPDWVDKVARRALPPISTLGAQPLVGWVTGRHNLDANITDETAAVGGNLRITLMKAEKQVAASLLRAECRIEELARETATGRPCDRRTKSEIRKDVEDRLQAKAQPVLRGIGVVHHLESNLYFAEAVSDKQADALEIHWHATMGSRLWPVTPETMAVAQHIDLRDQKPTSFSPDVDDDACECSIGQDFLTWLWYHSETSGIFTHAGNTFGVLIEGPLRFAGNGSGAQVVAMDHGSPEISAEAKVALLAGKKLTRARVSFAYGKDLFSCSFDADRFVFRGLRLPNCEAFDPVDRFEERMRRLYEFAGMFTSIFSVFAGEYTTEKWTSRVAEIRTWVSNRQGRF